jgi:hypothetical protein
LFLNHSQIVSIALDETAKSHGCVYEMFLIISDGEYTTSQFPRAERIVRAFAVGVRHQASGYAASNQRTALHVSSASASVVASLISVAISAKSVAATNQRHERINAGNRFQFLAINSSVLI